MKVSTSLANSEYLGMCTDSKTAYPHSNIKSVQQILTSASRECSLTQDPAALSLIYSNTQ